MSRIILSVLVFAALATALLFCVGCQSMTKPQADQFASDSQAQIDTLKRQAAEAQAAKDAAPAGPKADQLQKVIDATNKVAASMQKALDNFNAHRNPDGSSGPGDQAGALVSALPFPFNIYGGLVLTAAGAVGGWFQAWQKSKQAQQATTASTQLASTTAALIASQPTIAAAVSTPAAQQLIANGLDPHAANLLNNAIGDQAATAAKLAA